MLLFKYKIIRIIYVHNTIHFGYNFGKITLC